MSATVTFFGKDLQILATYTLPDDASVITTVPFQTWVTHPVGITIKVNPESGNDMMKQRIQVLENKFRRFTQDITDSIDRLDM